MVLEHMGNAQPKVPTVICLRTPQVRYLEYLAERDAGPVSQTLDWIIRDRMKTTMQVFALPAKKVRGCYTLSPECLVYVDKLGVQWGLERSDVIRRLIDDAQMKDETV